MSFYPGGFVLILLAYALVAAVLALLAYLVLRFAIRDGLRAHTLWLERRPTTRATAGPDDEDRAR